MYIIVVIVEKLFDIIVVLKLLFLIYKYECNFCCREGGYYGGGGVLDFYVMWFLFSIFIDVVLYVWFV